MNYKIFLSFIFFIFVVLSLTFYWIIPLNKTEFQVENKNSNFSINSNSLQKMQFYPNMRFEKSKISYKINPGCTLQKENEMLRAFELLSNVTTLNFFVSENAEIIISCDSKTKIKEGMFIAGEGGPTNITEGKLFNLISGGTILLIRDSKCENPNIALHELLHVLGFNHSENKNNIMYPISECGQTLGDDIPTLINKLYSVKNYPDLEIDKVTAEMRGRYLDTNITIKNNGLKDSEDFQITIYADDKKIKTLEVESIKINYGKTISLSNLFVNQISIEELKFSIKYDFPELDKSNNEIWRLVPPDFPFKGFFRKVVYPLDGYKKRNDI